MTDQPQLGLSRRERQIMDIVYRLGSATAHQVLAHLADPPGYSSIRAHLRILEDKGHLTHAQDGPRYVYAPTVPREEARRSVLQNLLRTFFDGSREKMMAALLDTRSAEIPAEELEAMSDLIERVRRKERS
ncbi:BlaI/MecI/CopY family transcriptional regulator [bacterium]|nr:BlaI/MecI/CopY family transcriptional regulator [bacterium]MBU1073512.1 BlaI/MecI/CopY family transcriptional regulator [bacterium]MBU1676231.1 BlaI/MecI/CopY family transcriptional regulator [bacterium]